MQADHRDPQIPETPQDMRNKLECVHKMSGFNEEYNGLYASKTKKEGV